MTHCPSFEELNALIDGGLPPGRELDVRRHLDLCAACAGTADGITTIKRAVGRAFESETPSPALRQAIAAHAQRQRASWRWWAIAALVLAAFSTQAFRGDHTSGLSALAALLVADHVQALTTPETLQAMDDPEDLSGWFRNQLPYPVSVKLLPDWRLVGGRRTMLFGHATAVASYERSGDRVSLFMTNAAITAPNHPIRESFEAVSRRRCRNIDLYRVCLHREGDMLIGIVASGRARPERLLPAAKSS